MSRKRTPEPWYFRQGQYSSIVDCHHRLIAQNISPEDGLRIVECVNAMKGIEDPEAFMEVVKKLELDAYQNMKKERDELLRWKMQRSRKTRKLYGVSTFETLELPQKIGFLLALVSVLLCLWYISSL